MAFSTDQIKNLERPLRRQFVKSREVAGKTLNFLEGWRCVAEANRIFGFDGWDRETVSSECVWRAPVEGGFAASYLTRVRLKVRAGNAVVVREGLGSGEAIAATPGQAHERASKSAETDATKRALSTFGNPFGLSLYRGNAPETPTARTPPLGLNPENMNQDAAAPSIPANGRIALLPVHLPPFDSPVAYDGNAPHKIDKSALTFGEPRRIRSSEHLRFVRAQPCLVCGRLPSQAHHLRYMQPRAISRKVSDEFTVPLCALHHQELHLQGSEQDWWAKQRIDPVENADNLWRSSTQQTLPTG